MSYIVLIAQAARTHLLGDEEEQTMRTARRPSPKQARRKEGAEKMGKQARGTRSNQKKKA